MDGLVFLRELVRLRVLVRAGFFAAALVAVFGRAEVFARDAAGFFGVLRLAAERLVVDRFLADDLRAPVVRAEAEFVEVLALPSTDHLPDITR